MTESNFIEQSKLRFREGEVIYRRGEMGERMFILLTGRVDWPIFVISLTMCIIHASRAFVKL